MKADDGDASDGLVFVLLLLGVAVFGISSKSSSNIPQVHQPQDQHLGLPSPTPCLN
jgi:hypothetical protein